GGPGGFASPDGPSPMQAEKNEARAKLYSGTIPQKQRQFMSDVRKWAGDHAIYAIGNEGDMERLLPNVTSEHRKVVARVATPKPSPEVEPQQQGPGMGGGGDGGGPRGGGGGGPFGGFFGRGPRGGRGGGGPFGPGLALGEEIVIVKWDGK